MTNPTKNTVDPDFIALPLDEMADVAIATAQDLGAEWVDVRVVRSHTNVVGLRDTTPEGGSSGFSESLGVRVIVDGRWGFASDPVLDADGARRAAQQAVELAYVSRPLPGEKVSLAPVEPIGTASWTSSWEIDPFTVSDADKLALLTPMAAALLESDVVDHVDTYVYAEKEQKFYGDITGNRLTSQRIRIEGAFSLTAIDEETGRVTSLRTLAQPTARGWEWMTGATYDWATELTAMPDVLAAKIAAPSVEPGTYDIILDPTNLWLTIHESIGHATELDRVLGFEANYAGTTFASLDMLDTFQYGTGLLNVDGDRNAAFGLASVGFDDEGIASRSFPLITEGVLVDFQADRATATLAGRPGSNGCAYADDATSVPLQRMPNVSMRFDPNGPDVAEMIAGVKNGLYVRGDDSWSIDMQRYNFQFTGQEFWLIRDGKIVGQVRDAAYQSTTQQFWNSLVQVGSESTYRLGGALNCGKGQPGQSAPVSHGCPAARFNDIRILNTTEEVSA